MFSAIPQVPIILRLYVLGFVFFCFKLLFNFLSFFYQGDPLKIVEDLVALRPTLFPSVPRLFNRIREKIMAGVVEAGGIKRKLFDMG